jgi:hypothetical protein
MALIKSKQLQNVAADKVVETAAKRFVSDVEKAVYSDKYTKAETDTIKTDLETSINDTQTTLQANIDAVQDDLDATETSLTTQIGNVNSSLSNQISTVQSTLSAQISNAIAGLTWKSPVPTFADIVTTYPTPEEGWMVTVEDSNKVYRYDAATTSWVEFPIQVPQTYSKTILVPIAVNGTTEIYTGIRNDNTGLYKTGHAEIELAVNGFTQAPGADKDYTTAFVSNQLVITWKNRHFQLETDDEVQVTYTHFDVV